MGTWLSLLPICVYTGLWGITSRFSPCPLPADGEVLLDADGHFLPLRDFVAPHLAQPVGNQPLPPGAKRYVARDPWLCPVRGTAVLQFSNAFNSLVLMSERPFLLLGSLFYAGSSPTSTAEARTCWAVLSWPVDMCWLQASWW